MFLRDAHFVIGEEDEKKTEEDDNLVSDPKYVTFTCYSWQNFRFFCVPPVLFFSVFVRVFVFNFILLEGLNIVFSRAFFEKVNYIKESDFAFEGVINLRFLENEKMSQ